MTSGYNTFSAALDVLRVLEQQSAAYIIGLPPGDYAASSGDPKTYTLDQSQIKVQLSSVFHPTVFPNDMRPMILLDQKLENSWEAYQQGKDLIYDFIKNNKPSPLVPALAADFQEALGRFTFDQDKHTIIKSEGETLFIEISKTLRSPLYPKKGKRFSTEVKGFEVELGKSKIHLHFPDGTSNAFERITTEKSALEYLYEGNFTVAKTLYSALKKQAPKDVFTSDGRFSNLALFAFFEWREKDREKASRVAKGILQLGIELNAGNAPYCEFAMRFY